MLLLLLMRRRRRRRRRAVATCGNDYRICNFCTSFCSLQQWLCSVVAPLPLPWSLLSNNVSGEYAHSVLSQASYPQVKISGWLEGPERPKSRTEGAKQLKPISRSKKQVDCTPQLCNLTKCKGHQPHNHNRVTEIM